jgi:hypothetical protein
VAGPLRDPDWSSGGGLVVERRRVAERPPPSDDGDEEGPAGDGTGGWDEAPNDDGPFEILRPSIGIRVCGEEERAGKALLIQLGRNVIGDADVGILPTADLYAVLDGENVFELAVPAMAVARESCTIEIGGEDRSLEDGGMTLIPAHVALRCDRHTNRVGAS